MGVGALTGTRPDRTSAPPAAPQHPVRLEAHGDSRVDPWYWLRERDSPEVLAHLAAENAYAAARLAHLAPLRDALFAEISSHVQLTDVSATAPKPPFAYYQRTLADAQHPRWCRRPVGAAPPSPAAADAAETVLVDEDALARGHDYFHLGDSALSSDQALLAYAFDTAGDERMTVAIRDLARGELRPDVLENACYGLAFSADATWLFYLRPDEAMRPYQCWRHRLGTAQADDVCVYEEADERFHLALGTTKDDAFVVLVAASNTTSECSLIDALAPERAPRCVEPRREGVEYHLEHHSGTLFILVNDAGATNFRLVRAPVDEPGRARWTELVAHRPGTALEGLEVVGDHVVLAERGDATTALRVLDATGRTVELLAPPVAGVIGLGEMLDAASERLRSVTTSLVAPREVRELDLSTGSSALVRREPVPGGFDPGSYRSERLFARAPDGTAVPITIAWRDGRAPGGPLVLYGYGAYGASVDPRFSPLRLPLLDRGVAYAIAHVRGGEELGREWYLDGKLENKAHSFTDFVACARELVELGWTSPSGLVARGASAGGLLVAAAANLAPELFAAVVAEVPFVDCLTTLLDPELPLTVIEWEEWGNPLEDPDAYAAIRSWSPYDNVAATRYPAMYVSGGLEDPRVGYFEPAKWVQRLRAAHPDNAERVLLDVEMSGHAGPSGRDRHWRKEAEVLAFILDAVGLA